MFRPSRFGELLEGLSRTTVYNAAEKHQSDKHYKRFGSWNHIVAMVYAQLSGARSLREMETGFNAQIHHHYHLGVDELRRSTLSDANALRGADVFAEVCTALIGQAHRKVRRVFAKQLYILDSSPIPLKGLGYEWAEGRGTARVKGLSVHMMIEPRQAVPVLTKITDPNVTDLNAAKEMVEIEKDATYVFDKGYCDYNWWYKIHVGGGFYVTRLKKNAGVEVVKHRQIKVEDQGYILEDSTIRFKHEQTSGSREKNAYYSTTLRRIVVDRPDKKTPLVLVTNDRKRSARQIAKLYKQRWEIELFFKWLKQNLKIKQFLGRSENAVKIQIYSAIIAYLLVSNYRKTQGSQLTMKMLLTLFKTDMFSRPSSNKSKYQKRKIERDKIRKVQRALSF